MFECLASEILPNEMRHEPLRHRLKAQSSDRSACVDEMLKVGREV
jgi:hypothetical protein